MTLANKYQYDPGDIINFTLDNAVYNLYGDGHPQTVACNYAPGVNGSPVSFPGQGSFVYTFSFQGTDYDNAQLPAGALGLLPGGAWAPDTIRFQRQGHGQTYDFSAWVAALNFQWGYSVQRLAVDSCYILLNSDSSSVQVTIPRSALATGVSFSVTRNLYVGKIPYQYQYPSGYKNFNQITGVDGYRIFVLPVTYTAATGQQSSAFFVAAHWAITNTSPESLPSTDTSLVTLALTPALAGVPNLYQVGQSFGGAVFQFDSESSYGPFLGPPFAPATFYDSQEGFLEDLGSSNSFPYGQYLPSASSSGLVDTVKGPRAVSYPPGTPQGDFHIRWRAQYQTQQVPRVRQIYGSFWTSSRMLYDDGPQFLDVTSTKSPAPPPPPPPGVPDPQDAGDAAQDTATGRTTKVSSATTGTAPNLTTTLTTQAWEGWQNVAGPLAKISASLLDAAGQPVLGQYPSLWKTSEEGRYSLCYQDAAGRTIRAVSLDGLSSLMAFPLILFTDIYGSPRTGGRPGHTQDGSTGVYYVAAAFTLLDTAGHPTGKEDIIITRVDATDTVLRWADGTTQKTVVLNTAAAGRPSLILSRYNPAQPVLLLHGDRKFLGDNNGEIWSEILT